MDAVELLETSMADLENAILELRVSLARYKAVMAKDNRDTVASGVV